MINTMVFDIETVPDVEFGRRHLGVDEALDDATVGQVMLARRRQQTGGEFLPLHQHRIVAISVVLRSRDTWKVWSLGDGDSNEADLIRRFFDGIERFSPDLVSWNGSGFDLPVLHYRALRHGVAAVRYWETGDSDQSFRWNNYLNRFHWRHLDLMDVLAAYQARARAPLDEIAVMLGFPGKLGMSGDQVWDQWLAGNVEAIRNYCETDVINTYLVFLRFQLMRGQLDEAGYAVEIGKVRDALDGDQRPHLAEYVAAWDPTA